MRLVRTVLLHLPFQIIVNAHLDVVPAPPAQTIRV